MQLSHDSAVRAEAMRPGVMCQDLDEAFRDTASQLEGDNPNWIVVFGGYTRQYIALPRFRTPNSLRLESRDAAELARRMFVLEQYLGLPTRPYAGSGRLR